ncbi:MAG TPA: hypothetical protein VH640_27940 [Bryobacteraceae bacterium]
MSVETWQQRSYEGLCKKIPHKSRSSFPQVAHQSVGYAASRQVAMVQPALPW